MGKKNAEPTATPGPTPARCEGIYEGMHYSVRNNTTLTQPFPDQLLGAWEVYDRQVELRCGEGGKIEDIVKTSQMRLYRTPTPTKDPTPTSSSTNTPTEEIASTSTNTPSETPTRIPIPTNSPIIFPAGCVELAQAGWVDASDGTECFDTTYYRTCGPPTDEHCMYNRKGFDEVAVQRIIPYGEETSIQCSDGSTAYSPSDDEAWEACQVMLMQARGAELPPGISDSVQSIVGCVYPGMSAEMEQKGFSSDGIAVNMSRTTPLQDYGLGEGFGVLCRFAPATQ